MASSRIVGECPYCRELVYTDECISYESNFLAHSSCYEQADDYRANLLKHEFGFSKHKVRDWERSYE